VCVRERERESKRERGPVVDVHGVDVKVLLVGRERQRVPRPVFDVWCLVSGVWFLLLGVGALSAGSTTCQGLGVGVARSGRGG